MNNQNTAPPSNSLASKKPAKRKRRVVKKQAPKAPLAENVAKATIAPPALGPVTFPTKVAAAIITMSEALLDQSIGRIPRSASLNIGGDLFLISNNQIKNAEIGRIYIRREQGYYELDDLKGRANRLSEKISVATRHLLRDPAMSAVEGSDFEKMQERNKRMGIRDENARQVRRRQPRIEEKVRLEEELARVEERMTQLGEVSRYEIKLSDMESLQVSLLAEIVSTTAPVFEAVVPSIPSDEEEVSEDEEVSDNNEIEEIEEPEEEDAAV